jgi:hypothetical protein
MPRLGRLLPAIAGGLLAFGGGSQASPPDATKYIVINLVDPAPGHEAEMAAHLNQHGRLVTRYSGVLSFRLFEAVGENGAAPASPYRFMQVHELDRPRELAKPPVGAIAETPRPPSRASVTYVFTPVGERIAHEAD